jgi:hypothetical protein
MAVGIQIWDASGNSIIDENSRLARILGITNSGTSGGSVTDSGFATGSPFAVFIPNGTTYFTGEYAHPSWSGTTMSWSASVAGKIIYGVY